MNIVLITAIEPNQKDINTLRFGYSRNYELEAIKCFEEFRKNGGWLKDIEIYTMCPTKDDISQDTKDKFKELNVNYIHEYLPDTENFTCGYWNIPLVGLYFEKKFRKTNTKLLKIDLDMYLMKELPKSLFEKPKVIVGRYDEISAKHNTNKLNYPDIYGYPFDTGIIISDVKSKFYKKFYEELVILTEEHQNNTLSVNYGIRINEADETEYLDYGVIEEFSVSVLNLKQPDLIDSITKYNIGEFYAGLEHYKDSEIPGIYFIHEHLPPQEKEYSGIMTRIQYKKRVSKL